MTTDTLTNDMDEDSILEHLPAIEKLTKDLRQSAYTLGDREARYLVDLYYIVQENRKRAFSQIRAMGEEPHKLLQWYAGQMKLLEDYARTALDTYSTSRYTSQWARHIIGIGPVIAAGLTAHIDVSQQDTVGRLWAFAGYDPNRKWEGRARATKIVKDVMGTARSATPEHIEEIARAAHRKAELLTDAAMNDVGKITAATLITALARRPYNARLKVVCWKASDSFKKVSGNPKSLYGRIYRDRKELEVERNEAGMFRDQAERALAAMNYSKDTGAYKAYSVGRLPPAHLDARAMRYAVKIFLAHYHEIAYRDHFGTEPPLPFILTQPNHTHKIEAPGMDDIA